MLHDQCPSPAFSSDRKRAARRLPSAEHLGARAELKDRVAGFGWRRGRLSESALVALETVAVLAVFIWLGWSLGGGS